MQIPQAKILNKIGKINWNKMENETLDNHFKVNILFLSPYKIHPTAHMKITHLKKNERN